MVARGETIGRAVVKIIADGNDLGKQIERDLEKAEGPIRASGRRSSDAYSDEFNKRMSQKDIGKGIRESLERGIAKSDVAQAYFGSRDWKRFQGLLHKRFGDLGNDAGRDLSTEFAHNLGGINDAVEGIFTRLERLRKGGDVDLGDATLNVRTAEDFDGLLARVKAVRAQIAAQHGDIDLGDATLTVRVAEDLDGFLARVEAMRAKIAATGRDIDLGDAVLNVVVAEDLDGFLAKVEALRARLAAEGDIDLGDATMHVRVAEDDDIDGVVTHLRRVGDEVDNVDRRGGRARRTFTGFGRLIETIGHRVEVGGGLTGRIFGKGSRNDFFNIVGSIVGGLTTATGTLVRFAGEVTSAFAQIGTGAREASGILERFGTTITGALSSLATAGPPIVLAFAVIVAAIGTATAAFSLLAGAITALAGSLAFAIVGALAPIAGLIGPVALVIAGVVAGLTKMNKEAKKTLKEAVKPLADGFKDLGRQVRIGFIEGLKNTGGIDAFAKTLRDLRPLFRLIGESIATMLGQFGNLTRGKAFQDFISTMERTLPTTMRRLGAIFANVLGGILNVFTVLNQPGGPVSQFLIWLQRITREFLDWSNTKKGRDSIAGFFDRAVESAKAWGKLLLAAGGIIGDLFAKGKGAGDNIVTSLTDALNEFGDWLEDPANQKAIQQWFSDSEKFAGSLGELAVAFANLADAADDPNTRKNVEAIMKALTLGVNLGSVAVKLNSIALAMDVISGVKAKAPDIFGALEDFGGSIGQKLQPAVETVRQVVGSIVGFFQGLPAKIGAALSGIGSAISGVADSIVGFFAAIPGRIGAALSGIGSSIAGVVTRIVGFFASLPGLIVAAVAPIPGRVNAFFDQLLFNIGFTVGRIVKFFITLPARIGAALGNLGAVIRGHFSDAASNVPGLVERIVGFFRSLPGRIGRAIAGVAAIIRAQFAAALGRVQGIVERIVGFFRSLPGRVGRAIASVAGIIRSRFADAAARIPAIVARIVAFFAALPGRVGRAISSVIGIIRSRFAEAASRIPAIISRIVGYFAALPGRISNAIGNLWGRIAAKFQAIPGNVAGVVSRIVGEFAGLGGRILSAIGSIDIASLVRFPAGKVGSLVRGFLAGVSASGGIFTGAQTRIIGEAGPEAIVPLNRPLSQVDPAVRQLSAIAQGLTMASGGVVGGPSRVVNVGGLTVITPTKNPTAVAVEAVNRLVAVGY